MSITDELRAWLARKFPVIDKEWHEEFTAIADRIDAEHEAACAEAYGNGVMSVPIALDESEWVKLPIDADGVPIHVGDVMEFLAFEIEKPVTRIVDGIGQGVFFAWCGERGYQQHEAKRYRHYHKPTVEDVLREFVAEFNRDDSELCDEEIIERFAAKLRLAKEGE